MQVKTAPRVSKTAAGHIAGTFRSLNAGLEYIADAWPVLYKRTLSEVRGRFSDNELRLIVDVFNATTLTPQLAGQHLLASVSDGIALDGLDEKWGVDGDDFLDRLRALTSFQAACLEVWANGFWYGGRADGVQDLESWIAPLSKK